MNTCSHVRFGGARPAATGPRWARCSTPQVDDVAAAVAYVKGLPEVDRTRIAVAGCSVGGIQSLLAAERDLGIRT